MSLRIKAPGQTRLSARFTSMVGCRLMRLARRLPQERPEVIDARFSVREAQRPSSVYSWLDARGWIAEEL